MQSTSSTLYYNGKILTMAAAAPEYAEAVVTEGGTIAFVGPFSVARTRFPHAALRDLGGRTMIPGIVDSHSHLFQGLSMAAMVNVSAPPVGPCNSLADLVNELKRGAAQRNLKPGQMMFAYGYDNQLLGHLTRDHLDPVFPENPVVVLHVSMHGAVLNGLALAHFGFTKDYVVPAGGVIERRDDGEPMGLVFENAFGPVFKSVPVPSGPESEIEMAKAAQVLYASHGVTTAQEGATIAGQLEILQRVAAAGELFLDVISYPYSFTFREVLSKNKTEDFGKYLNNLKLGGIKFVTDGSPQARTAFFTTPYLLGGPTGQGDWRGEPNQTQEQLNKGFKDAYDSNIQVLAHANGDGSIDMVIKAHEFAGAGSFEKDRRTVVVHSQFARPDQLLKYKQYNLTPSFFAEHTFFFSAAHLKNRGPEQTSFISPMRAALDLGIPCTNHTDFPVLPINQILALWSSVNRVNREGVVIGPEQRITPYEGLQAITINGARQYFEESIKGSIEVGKMADLVVLSENPLTVEPMKIKDITVLETIKRGRTIFKAY